jgi:single-strand selective monofunctional uracil DNA glycosylase
MHPLVQISRDLSHDVGRLRFGRPVEYVYNPLTYARLPHEAYLERYGTGQKKVLLLGMNPGPFGMAQTGIPFGDVTLVRDFLGIEAAVERPRREHPKRPVKGFACERCEVSGTRLWGFARDRFESPKHFFRTFFVANYCPLAFVEESGRNFTPDKLPAKERAPLFAACNRALVRIVDTLRPDFVIGVGAFAADRAREALESYEGTIGSVLHPSPASPKANRGWADLAAAELERYGISLRR